MENQFYTALIALPLFVGFMLWLEGISRADRGKPQLFSATFNRLRGFSKRVFFKTRVSAFSEKRKGALGVGTENYLWV